MAAPYTASVCPHSELLITTVGIENITEKAKKVRPEENVPGDKRLKVAHANSAITISQQHDINLIVNT